MTTLLVRWFLLVLLAFDLASSPFHAHVHDMGVHDLAVHAVADGPMDADDDHVLDHDDLVTGHSLTAIRSVEVQVAADPIAVHWDPIAVPWIATLLSPVPRADAVIVGWSAAPIRIPPSRRLHVRPDGRAPPVLHA